MTPRVAGGLLVAGLAVALAGCEVLTGISDKTLSSSATGIPCAHQPAFEFCDDFDTEASFGQTWDWHIDQPGGTAAFDTTDYATAPRSGRFGSPGTTAASAQLGKLGIALGTSLHLAFDLRLDVDDPSTLPQTSVAQVLTMTSALSINYVVGPGAQASLQVFDQKGGVGPVTEVVLPVPPTKKWTHLVLDTDWQTISVEEDGSPIGSAKAFRTGPPGPTEMIMGIVYENPSTGATTVTLELDDIVLGGS